MHKEIIPIPPPPEEYNKKNIEVFEYYDFNLYLKKIVDSRDMIIHNSFCKRDNMSIIKICCDMGKVLITFIYSKVYPKKDTLYIYNNSEHSIEALDLYKMCLEKKGFNVSEGLWTVGDIKILDSYF